MARTIVLAKAPRSKLIGAASGNSSNRIGNLLEYEPEAAEYWLSAHYGCSHALRL